MESMRLALIFACMATLMANMTGQTATSEKGPAQASLEGKVVKESAGEPLKKAIIELIGENQEEGDNFTATSDQDGHYKIAGIHPGRYRLFVERSGYIEVDARRRRSDGVVLSFEAGQELKDRTLHMLAAAVVAGRVVDEDGDPMANVDVTVLRRRFSSGGFKFEPSGSSQTNDLGEYRIGGLLAGKYYVSASPLPNFQSIVHAQMNSGDSETSQPDMAYVTTFYPNTPDRNQASAIGVHAGEDMPLDFSLVRTHTARIRGSVAGIAPGTKAMVLLRGRDSNSMYNASEVGQDGKFEILHVAPGSYSVTAMTMMTDPPRMARSTVEVTDTNIEGLVLSPLAGAMVRGRVRLAGTISKADASLLFVYLRPRDADHELSEGVTFADDAAMASPGMGRVKADGSFELKNVQPAVYEVEVSGDAKGMSDCFVESVITGTKDVADSGLRVSGGTISIDVMVTSGAGLVDGNVTTEKNEPVADAVVVAVPEEKYRKQQSRYAKVSTDQHGHFTMRGLRPGTYTLLAWENLDGDDYFDPDYLKKYEGHESGVRVEKGGHQNASLKVIPAAPDQP
jgi:protocatechuate 3,4-dioxygenase beta subunit